MNHVIVSTGAPNAAPDFVGQHYIDTTTDTHYTARGTASVNDWSITPKTIGDATNLAFGEGALGSLTPDLVNFEGVENIAIGKNALAAATFDLDNVAVGNYALENANDYTNNIAIGNYSLNANTAGYGNVSVGGLSRNTTGFLNVAVGSSTLAFNTVGSRNVAMGNAAILSLTSGVENTAIGDSALAFSSANSDFNTAIGSNAMAFASGAGENTAIGHKAAGISSSEPTFAQNTMVGAQAGANATRAIGSVMLGYKAGLNASFTNNIAIGSEALANTSNSFAVGSGDHIAIGRRALATSQPNGAPGGFTTGGCIAIGTQALESAGPSSTANTAIGTLSQPLLLDGAFNTTVGFAAGNSIVSTFNVTAVGAQCLQKATAGNNTGVGSSALRETTTGSNNTAIGNGALLLVTSGSNNFAIGNSSGIDALRTITTESNEGVIGNNNTTAIYSKVALTVTSDIRDKTKIRAVPHGLDFIEQLDSIAYQFRASRDSDEAVGRVHYGFSAQQILALQADQAIVDASDPENLKLNSQDLIAVLVNAVKELSAEVKSLKAKLSE